MIVITVSLMWRGERNDDDDDNGDDADDDDDDVDDDDDDDDVCGWYLDLIWYHLNSNNPKLYMNAI